MPFLIYLVQVFLYSGALWVIYCLTWRRTSLHRCSRAYLLLAALLPLFLPLIRLRSGVAGNEWVQRYQLPDFKVIADSVIVNHNAPVTGTIGLAYASVALLLVCFYVAGYVRIFSRIASGTKQLIAGNKVYTGAGIGPGTIGRSIFFPGQTYDEQILRHEEAHIRAGHRYDLWLMQVLTAGCWANPFVWILLRELKMVHEFEADAAVADSRDVSAYAGLLLSEIFGLRDISIVHAFFHHPLKRRIIMLQKSHHKPGFARLFIGTALLTAFLCTAIVLVQCKPEKADSPVARTDANNTVVYKLVDKMPEFKGDLSAYLAQNIHYPEAARAANKEGRTVIQFIIGQDGTVKSVNNVRPAGEPDLDAEAMRVVKQMPRWKPGMQDGRPVSVYFTLPITFKLGD